HQRYDVPAPLYLSHIGNPPRLGLARVPPPAPPPPPPRGRRKAPSVRSARRAVRRAVRRKRILRAAGQERSRDQERQSDLRNALHQLVPPFESPGVGYDSLARHARRV